MNMDWKANNNNRGSFFSVKCNAQCTVYTNSVSIVVTWLEHSPLVKFFLFNMIIGSLLRKDFSELTCFHQILYELFLYILNIIVFDFLIHDDDIATW